MFCPPARLSVKYNGGELSEEVELNNNIELYNKQYPDKPLVLQPVTHFSGCVNGKFEHDPIYPTNARDEAAVRLVIDAWLGDNNEDAFPSGYQAVSMNTDGKASAPEQAMMV
jgi:hypothetical protein